MWRVRRCHNAPRALTRPSDGARRVRVAETAQSSSRSTRPAGDRITELVESSLALLPERVVRQYRPSATDTLSITRAAARRFAHHVRRSRHGGTAVDARRACPACRRSRPRPPGDIVSAPIARRQAGVLLASPKTPTPSRGPRGVARNRARDRAAVVTAGCRQPEAAARRPRPIAACRGPDRGTPLVRLALPGLPADVSASGIS